MRKSTMLKSLAVSAAMLVSAADGLAEERDKLDLGSLTCKEMMRLPDHDREAVMGFYFGHAAAKDGNVVLDLTVAADTADKVIDDCLSNPTDKAMAIFAKYNN